MSSQELLRVPRERAASVWQKPPSPRKPVRPSPRPSATPVQDDEANQSENRSFLNRWLDGHFTIVPGGSPIVDAWDVVIISALMATAFVVPYEVALVEKPPPGLAMFDACVSIVFAVDIVLTFNMAFVSPGFHDQDIYVIAPRRIAAHYMAVPFSRNFDAGWFWPDLITVVPWEHVFSGSNVTSVRMVRVVRLMRMFRLVRVIKLFVRGHTKYGFSFALEKLIAEFTTGEIYRLSLYFCVVVLTTVGFGDLRPVTYVETIMMTITVFITGLTWAWVVANVVGVISNMDAFSMHFNQAMDDLNILMTFLDVDRPLQIRVRKHMHEAYAVHQSRHHWEMIQWLSPLLQGELAVLSGKDLVCNCIWYFRGLERGPWVTDLVLHFIAELYSADEVMMDRSAVSVVRKGMCVNRGKLMMKDAVFGADMILASDHLRDSSCPRTLTIVEVMKLDRAGLLSVCRGHYEVNIAVRKAQVRLAVCRALVVLAAKLRRRVEKGLGWSDEDFRTMAQSFRLGFVQQANAVSIHDDAIPTNHVLDSIGAEIKSIGQLVKGCEAETRRRLEALSRRVEDIDRRACGLLQGAQH